MSVILLALLRVVIVPSVLSMMCLILIVVVLYTVGIILSIMRLLFTVEISRIIVMRIPKDRLFLHLHIGILALMSVSIYKLTLVRIRLAQRVLMV